MTSQQARSLISLAIPADRAQSTEIADAALEMAVSKYGRMPNSSWNRDDVTFNLTSGTSKYDLGKDIISKYPEIWNIQYLYRTDTTNAPVPIKPIEVFNSRARGSSTTGAPEMVTLYSYTKTLEVYPEPDATYTLWAYVRKEISTLEEIPRAYHDGVIELAMLFVKAVSDPNLLLTLAKDSFYEIMGDSLSAFTGNIVSIDRHVGQVSGGTAFVDSGNLRGD